EDRFFRRAVSYLFRWNAEARGRRESGRGARSFDTTAHLAKLVQMAESAAGPEFHPVRFRVNYTLTVQPGHPLVKPGSKVRAWLPFPQEYRQQRDVQLLSTDPPKATVAENGSAHRTIFLEREVTDPQEPLMFSARYEFTNSAFYPKLSPDDAKP